MLENESGALVDFGPFAADYDKWYETPDGSLHNRFQKELVSGLLPPARHGEKLLDVGCGTGHWSRFFSSLGYEVTGIDNSADMIAVARSNVCEGCEFELSDAEHIPYPEDSFDVVATMATLEFLARPRKALDEMARCLRPQGRLMIGTLNRLAPLNRERLASGKQPYASAHMFSTRELLVLLVRYGIVKLRTSAEGADKAEDGAFIVAEVRT